MEKRTVFLADANTFIAPSRNYYSFDFAPLFWERLGENIENGNILLLDKVYDELSPGDDQLSEWLMGLSSLVPIKHKVPAIISVYAEVLTHLQTSGFYNQKALAKWSDAHVADPWLIACAKVHECTVVTFETPVGNLNKQNKISNPKIPDVCNAFNVECTNLYNMMRILSIGVS